MARHVYLPRRNKTAMPEHDESSWIEIPLNQQEAVAVYLDVAEESALGSVWFIHGSFDGEFEERILKPRDHWYTPCSRCKNNSGRNISDLRSLISRRFGFGPDGYHTPVWSGENTIEARIEGARRIAGEITRWRNENRDALLVLIGFSHGGNVNKEIVNILSRQNPPIFVSTMINIGTPIAPSAHTLSAEVGQHINVFNESDHIQFAGARMAGNRLNDPRRYEGTEHNILIPARYSSNRGVRNHMFMHICFNVWERILLDVRPLLPQQINGNRQM
jgi:hypothetical protein